jgi:DNA-3-methyladenine glycosylase
VKNHAELFGSALPESFFARDARVVARALVGTTLVHVKNGVARVARIVETEAYRGPTDAACHARFGKTERTRALFGPPGTAYCFLVYGMHECFNIVSRAEGSGHAVLVRGAEIVDGVDAELRADGPGRFARALGFSRKDNGRSCYGDDLFFLPRSRRPRIKVTARVGVAYAEEHADWPLRFFDEGSEGVSRPSRAQIGRGTKNAPSRRAVSARSSAKSRS